MSLLKTNSIQIGQSGTATNNFTLAVPSSPDGTIKLARGNSGATTADVLTVNASGEITGATINGGTITSGTAVASTSGTAIDFTGIPSWVKRITLMFNRVNTSGTSNIIVQLGAGSFTATNYLSYSCRLGGSGLAGGANFTTGFGISGNSASFLISGSASIALLGSNIWTANGFFAESSGGNGLPFGGSIALSGTLDRVRITTVSGLNTFVTGSINIMYEG